ncbi:GTP-binding protein GEM [Striga asiatica]|uniref:GTP-binding protein GEM n=1 Tax=Striga asiatica TaxID=4170 RepID=A0A5A7QUF7_STRAF|nr:GTP-binding protein GEM [Striga asiatica]
MDGASLIAGFVEVKPSFSWAREGCLEVGNIYFAVEYYHARPSSRKRGELSPALAVKVFSTPGKTDDLSAGSNSGLVRAIYLSAKTFDTLPETKGQILHQSIIFICATG